METEYEKKLKNQHYAIIGSHSAVKLCTWTKKSIKNQGVCYKQKFYGIKSHLCIQMSPSVNFCDQDCIFCWRFHHNEPFKQIDDPKKIVRNSIIAQRKLLTGFWGTELANKKLLKEAQHPNQVAISLSGEPTYYPKLNELIKEYHKNNFTTFLVTNGQLPEVLKNIEPPTQLYISIDAPNKEIYEKIDNPMNKDGWDRLMKSCEVLRTLKKKTRTCLRITIVKGYNDREPENYSKIIEKAEPHFVEIKAYMFIGASRQRLTIKNMPRHNEIVSFAKEIEKYSGYEIVDEQPASRVVLMMKKKDMNMRFLRNSIEN